MAFMFLKGINYPIIANENKFTAMKNQLEITETAMEFLAEKKLSYPKIWTEEAIVFIT